MLIAAALSGFVLAIFAPWVHRVAPRQSGWLLSVLPFAIAAWLLTLAGEVGAGREFSQQIPWIPELGISFSFRLDGLSLVFSMLISGIGGLILIYAGGYLHGHPHLGRLLAFLLVFMASMLGLVLADNLIVLSVFWELTSISSFLLIGFDHERPAARDAALKALLVTGAGGLAFLAGALILQQITGTLEIPELIARADQIRSHWLYLPALLLVLAGAFTKSAQFPFHFWLPAAMEAPTPVSAYLHSATMVKAGIYLMARLYPALGGTDWWTGILVVTGGVTMILTAVLAVGKSDLKQILAYSTVAALGLLTFVLGIGGEYALQAAVVFLITHSFYKGALFMVAGAVDHETGTRSIDELSGLRALMPATALAAGLAALSMGGIPAFFGYLSKELVYEATLHSVWREVLTAAAVIMEAFTMAAALLAGFRPFAGELRATPKVPHEAPLSLLLGPVALAAGGLIFGVFPGLPGAYVVNAAATAIAQQEIRTTLALWHGFNVAFTLSLLTLATGFVLFLSRDRLVRALPILREPVRWGPDGWYETALAGTLRFASLQTRFLQTGYLPHYLRVIVVTALALAGLALYRAGMPVQQPLTEVRLYELTLPVLVLGGAVFAVRTDSRLAAIAALGAVGMGMALTFILFSAPDLAVTQILVEALTVILMVLVLYHLPGYTLESSRRERVRDAIFAGAAGAFMTFLVLAVNALQRAPGLSSYFVENSYELAHGRNIVNVILVDFRAFDTLGEITVLAVAAVGVFALLRLRPEMRLDGPPPEHRRQERRLDSLIVAIAFRFFKPLLLIMSLVVLFRGHQEPGGGFAGGLLAASALCLPLLRHDPDTSRTQLRVDPVLLCGIGLSVALCSGIAGLLAGQPFLTARGEGIGTVLFFDIGVYLTVLGVVVLIVRTLAEE